MTDHICYKSEDFTDEEVRKNNVLVVNVLRYGLLVCKNCGAAEVELREHPTCEQYRAHRRQEILSDPATREHRERVLADITKEAQEKHKGSDT